jgi:putative transposase
MKYFVPLKPNNKYHIFNQAVGSENLFRNDENYSYFLNKFNEYISPIASTFCYSLIPNHFHFMIEIKDKSVVYNHYKQLEISKEKTTFKDEQELIYEEFVMQQFSNFFNCYTKSYNKRFNRKGALFIDYMRRTLISDKENLRNLVLYIHQKPIHHHCSLYLDKWKYSSYNSFFSEKPSKIKREEVISWFGDLENFIQLHSIKSSIYNQPNL